MATDKVFELPPGYKKCSLDAQLVATTLLTVAGEIHDLVDAIDAMHNRLDAIESHLEGLSNRSDDE